MKHWRGKMIAILLGCLAAAMSARVVWANETDVSSGNALQLAEISFNNGTVNGKSTPTSDAATAPASSRADETTSAAPEENAAPAQDQPPSPPILFKESNGYPHKFYSGAKTRIRERFDIDGYVDKKYVYAIVDVEDERYVTGYLYDRKGNKEYVYGEFAYGALYVYDKKGKMYVIQVSRVTR